MSDDLGMLLRTAAYLAFEDGINDYTTPALAAARIAELETALIEIDEINAKRSGYNKAIDKIICEALE